jgi:hypothetical protein
MLATPADAEIILRLYELRTETVMRQARAWMTGEFWPATAEAYFAVAENPTHPHNAWLRQVLTYWEMAAAMVLHGAVSAELFVDCNAEGFFLLAKFAPILEGIRGAGEPFFGGFPALRGSTEKCRSQAEKPSGKAGSARTVFLSAKALSQGEQPGSHRSNPKPSTLRPQWAASAAALRDRQTSPST